MGATGSPPFRGVPSSDIKELLQTFVNRSDEMQQALLTLDEGENVLVRGITGIGKTAFIMMLLHELEQHARHRDTEVLPIHIRQFVGGTRQDLYRVVLYALAKALGHRSKHARDIVQSMTGEQLSAGRSARLGSSFEVGIPQVLKASMSSELSESTTRAFAVSHLEHSVNELLNFATKRYERVIIAIDDLERNPHQGSVKQMLESTLDLIRDNRCSFILTGRTLTIVEDIYASGLDIFNMTISLQPLAPSDLRLLAERNLNSVRVTPAEGSVFPFSDQAMEKIVVKSSGIPRQFVLLCGKILKIAIQHGEGELTLGVFDKFFDQYQDMVANSDVPPEILRVLYLGLQQGGFSIAKNADLEEVFGILGISSLKQFVDFADNLVQQDLLQRFAGDRGEILYRLAPGVEKLANSGARVEPCPGTVRTWETREGQD